MFLTDCPEIQSLNLIYRCLILRKMEKHFYEFSDHGSMTSIVHLREGHMYEYYLSRLKNQKCPTSVFCIKSSTSGYAFGFLYLHNYKNNASQDDIPSEGYKLPVSVYPWLIGRSGEVTQHVAVVWL